MEPSLVIQLSPFLVLLLFSKRQGRSQPVTSTYRYRWPVRNQPARHLKAKNGGKKQKGNRTGIQKSTFPGQLFSQIHGLLKAKL